MKSFGGWETGVLSSDEGASRLAGVSTGQCPSQRLVSSCRVELLLGYLHTDGPKDSEETSTDCWVWG